MSPPAMRVPSTSVFMVSPERRRPPSKLWKNGSGVTARTSVALTDAGRKALENYTTVPRQLLDSASQPKIGS
jgi:hypothetical protein